MQCGLRKPIQGILILKLQQYLDYPPKGFRQLKNHCTLGWSLRGRPYRYVMPSQHILSASFEGWNFGSNKKEGRRTHAKHPHGWEPPQKNGAVQKKNHGVWNEGSVVHLGKINGWKLRIHFWKKVQTSSRPIIFRFKLLPSRERSHIPQKWHVEDDFPFPFRRDMLIPWRVIFRGFEKNSTGKCRESVKKLQVSCGNKLWLYLKAWRPSSFLWMSLPST